MSKRRSMGAVLRQYGPQGSFVGSRMVVVDVSETLRDLRPWSGNVNPLLRSLLGRSGAMGKASLSRRRKGGQS